MKTTHKSCGIIRATSMVFVLVISAATVQAQSSFTVVVMDPDGRPTPFVNVTAVINGSEIYHASTDMRGRAKIRTGWWLLRRMEILRLFAHDPRGRYGPLALPPVAHRDEEYELRMRRHPATPREAQASLMEIVRTLYDVHEAVSLQQMLQQGASPPGISPGGVSGVFSISPIIRCTSDGCGFPLSGLLVEPIIELACSAAGASADAMQFDPCKRGSGSM